MFFLGSFNKIQLASEIPQVVQWNLICELKKIFISITSSVLNLGKIFLIPFEARINYFESQIINLDYKKINFALTITIILILIFEISVYLK